MAKKTVKWVAKKVVKPAVKFVKKTLSKINRTYSRGINVSVTPGMLSINFQAGISVDTKGNIAIQKTISGGVTGGSPSASVTEYESITNAPNIEKLEGYGYQFGGSAAAIISGIPLAAGADFNIIPDSDLNKTYFGTTTNVGIGVPGVELHFEVSNTKTWELFSINIFNEAEEIYIKIMEW